MTTNALTSLSEVRTNDDHSYLRPMGADVSGFPKNDAPYHRSPCPAMNTLANHGYIPRDGKNLTPEMIKQAIIDVFHMDAGIAQTLANALPPSLTLADLSVHGFIEHDASLVHDDEYFGHDPSQVNGTLVDELLQRADKDGIISAKALAHYRHDREAECKKTDPKYDFSLKPTATAYGEASLLVLGMGDYASESISVAHAKSFLKDERIPEDFERSKVAITTTKAAFVAAKIKVMSTYPWMLFSGY